MNSGKSRAEKYKMLITRSCGSALLGCFIAALVVFSLARYGASGQEPAADFSGETETVFVFPSSDSEMQKLAEQMLARQGAKLEMIEPAGGAAE